MDNREWSQIQQRSAKKWFQQSNSGEEKKQNESFSIPLDQKTIRRWIGLSASDSGGSNHVQPRLVSIRSLSQIRHSAVPHADHVTTKPSSSSHQHVLYILRCNDIMLFTVYEDGPWWWAWYAHSHTSLPMAPILYFIQRQLQSYRQHFIKHSIHTWLICECSSNVQEIFAVSNLKQQYHILVTLTTFSATPSDSSQISQSWGRVFQQKSSKPEGWSL